MPHRLPFYLFIFIFSATPIESSGSHAFFAISGGYRDMYYAAQFFVGSNQQPQTAIIDTGSDYMAFPCDMCEGNDCGWHEDSRFLSIDSKTFEPIVHCPATLLSPKMKACSFQKSYMERSSVSGVRAKDVFQFKSKLKQNGSSVKQFTESQQNGLMIKAEFGCTTKETGLFVSQIADGILGLDDSSSFIASMETEDSKHVKRLSFGVCFAPSGGFMSFELFGQSTLPPLPDSRVALVLDYDNSNSNYNLVLQKMTVENLEVEIDDIRATFDTGTTMTIFPQAMAQLLFGKLGEFCKKHPSKCGQINDPVFKSDFCMELKDDDPDFSSLQAALMTFPTIQMHFKGADRPYSLRPENYLFTIENSEAKSKKACLALDGDASLTRVIIGGFAMINHFVYFDRSHQKLAIQDQTDCTQPPNVLPRLAESEMEQQTGLMGWLNRIIRGIFRLNK